MTQPEAYPCPFMVWAKTEYAQHLPAYHTEYETLVHVLAGGASAADDGVRLVGGTLIPVSKLRALHDLPGQANSMAAWIARAVLGAKKTGKMRDCEVSVRQVKIGISIVTQLGSILITREAADLVLTESYVAAVRVPSLRMSSPELALACTVAAVVDGSAEVRRRR